jgi:sugar phosphate isomerase/epimerase
MEGFVDYAAGLDLDGVELTSYFFPDQITDPYLARLKRRCHLNGLDITGGAIRNNFTLPEGEKLQGWFDHVEQWADHYQALGAPVNRVFAGRPPKGVSEKKAIERAIPNLEKASELSGRRGVMLGLENHDFLVRIDRMMEIVKGVDSPWFGVNLDTGNFRSEDPYADIARAAPYAVNVQVKVNVRREGSGREPADLERVVKTLKDAGYSGAVVLEYEEGKPYEEIPRYLETLRKHMEA